MKLSPRPGHQYPLGPIDLTEDGENVVNPDNYIDENAKFGGFYSELMMIELKILALDKSLMVINPNLGLLGPGLSRDLYWLRKAIEIGYSADARDISPVAMKNIHLLFGQLIKEGKVKTVIGDIEETMVTDRIASWQTVAYFASQFFQVLGRNRMRDTLGKLGIILSRWPRGTQSKPRIYIGHPLPEDNIGPKCWNGVNLPGVKWGDTIPFSKDELCEALEHKLGGRKAVGEVLGKHSYYHQTYTLLKLSLAEA